MLGIWSALGRASAVAAALLLAGCTAETPSTAPGASGAAAPSAVASGALATQPRSADDTAPRDRVEGPGDFVLGIPEEGLAQLPSHRSRLVVEFEGTVDGESITWSTTDELASSVDPPAAVRTVQHIGPVPETEAAAGWSAFIAGTEYLDAGDGCVAAAADAGAQARLADPLASMPGLVGATAAGPETINGMPVDTYIFDGLALGMANAAQASGRVSVGSDDGPIVRYELLETGGPEVFGEGRAGTMTTTYDLMDAGTPITLDIPRDCPAGILDFLVPTEATNVESGPGRLRFDVPRKLDGAVAIVRGGAVIAHWDGGEGGAFEDEAHLSFTAEGLAIDAFLSATPSGAEVLLLAVRT